jgi:sulfite exporter TauE/SafE
LLVLEKAGARLWQHIEPLGRRFLPVQGSGQAFMLGLVWGWLPCGMVYAVLALALAGGSVLYGGRVMLAFGLGTLPLMVGMGFAIGALTRVLQGRILRTLAGSHHVVRPLYTVLSPPGMMSIGSTCQWNQPHPIKAINALMGPRNLLRLRQTPPLGARPGFPE